MAKKIILVIFVGLLIFSVIYALSGEKTVTTSSDLAYQAYQRGDALRKKLYYQDAIVEYEKAVQIDTNFAMAYAGLADLYTMHDRKDDAKRCIERAVSLFPLITEKERLIISIYHSGINEDTQSRYKKRQELIQKYPNSLEAHLYRATHFMEGLDYTSAINEFEKVIDKDPGYALGYNMLGYLNYYIGNFDDALLYIKKYSRLAEKEANPHDSYGEILMHLGRYDEAIREFETANKIKPDLFFVLNHLGDVHRNIYRFRDAIGYYERAKDKTINKHQVIIADMQIAFTYFFAKKMTKSLEILQSIGESEFDAEFVHLLYGLVYIRIGKIDLAEASLKELDENIAKSLETAEDSNRVTGEQLNRAILAAEIALDKGQYDKVEKLYESALDNVRLPALLLINYLYGDACYRMRKFDKAEKLLLSNLENNPYHTWSLFVLSQVYKEQGRIDDQKRTLLTYLSVVSGADEGLEDIITARKQLDSLMEL